MGSFAAYYVGVGDVSAPPRLAVRKGGKKDGLGPTGCQQAASSFAHHAAYHLYEFGLELADRRENAGIKGVGAVEHPPNFSLQLGRLASCDERWRSESDGN
jgi:hypothetical protein